MRKSRLFWRFVALVLAVATSCTDEKEVVLPDYIGCWQLVSYCGAPTEVDLYIQFKVDGKFTILQRNDTLGYAEYNGTYISNEESYTLSGVYNDGQKWACDYMYRVSDESKQELVLTSANENAEVSVYKSVNAMPSGGIVNTICSVVETENKKPL